MLHLNLLSPTGWLHKEMKNSSKASLKLKKRWFLLTHNSLDYYKSSERNALKLGTLVLNSLCSVVQPDEKVFKESGEKQEAVHLHGVASPTGFHETHLSVFLPGYWNVIVYGRKHSYRLYCKLLTEATRWASAIQNVIDTKAPIDTPTQQLIQDIKVGHMHSRCGEWSPSQHALGQENTDRRSLKHVPPSCSQQENCLNSEVVEQIYKRNPILRHSHHPLHSPLLPLPYGDIHLIGESRRNTQNPHSRAFQLLTRMHSY